MCPAWYLHFYIPFTFICFWQEEEQKRQKLKKTVNSCPVISKLARTPKKPFATSAYGPMDVFIGKYFGVDLVVYVLDRCNYKAVSCLMISVSMFVFTVHASKKKLERNSFEILSLDSSSYSV